MGFVMNTDMVYHYPIWAVGLLVMGAAMLGAVLLELCVRRLLPNELRRQHNDVAAAMLSIIGVTYAVLLAFVASLAWEGFNKAKAASHAEAAVVLDVLMASDGFAPPARAELTDRLQRYARTVVAVEW